MNYVWYLGHVVYTYNGPFFIMVAKSLFFRKKEQEKNSLHFTLWLVAFYVEFIYNFMVLINICLYRIWYKHDTYASIIVYAMFISICVCMYMYFIWTYVYFGLWRTCFACVYVEKKVNS